MLIVAVMFVAILIGAMWCGAVVSFKESKPSRFCLQHPIGAGLVVHAIIRSAQNSIDF